MVDRVSGALAELVEVESYGFDIPSWLGLSIDEIANRLGWPDVEITGPAPHHFEPIDWKTWFIPRASMSLHIEYDRMSRRMLKFIIEFDEGAPECMPVQVKDLLAYAGVNYRDDRYTIERRQSRHPVTGELRDRWSGLEITPTLDAAPTRLRLVR